MIDNTKTLGMKTQALLDMRAACSPQLCRDEEYDERLERYRSLHNEVFAAISALEEVYTHAVDLSYSVSLSEYFKRALYNASKRIRL